MCACAPAGRGDRGPCLCSQPRACSGQRGSWLGCKASGYPCLEQNQAGAGPGGLRQSCPFRPPTMHSPLVAQPPAPTPSPAAPELPFGVSGGARHWGALLGVWLCAALPHRATPIQARTPRHPPPGPVHSSRPELAWEEVLEGAFPWDRCHLSGTWRTPVRCSP